VGARWQGKERRENKNHEKESQQTEIIAEGNVHSGAQKGRRKGLGQKKDR